MTSLHKRFGITAFGIVASVVLAMRPSPASAQTQYTWNRAGGGDWNNGFFWSPLGIPHLALDTATFGSFGVGAVNISTSVLTQSLTFSNPTGNYTLTSSANQTLSGMTAINVDAAVTGTQTINLANVATGSLLFAAGNDLTITANGNSGLTLGPNTVIGTPGLGGIVVAGTGYTIISGSFASGANAVVGGITKTGPGALYLSGNGANLSGGVTLTGGNLLLDYRVSALPKLGSGTLTLAGGGFSLIGNSSLAVNEVATSGTIIGPAHTEIVLYTNSAAPSVTLNLNALTRSSFGTANINYYPSTSARTTTGLTNGILGGWITAEGSWATKSGSNIVALTSFGADTYAPGVNTDMTTGSGIPANFTTNSIRVNNADTSVTAVLSGTNTIQSGGILAAGYFGSSAIITGGTLTSGTGQLIVHAFANLTIDSSFNLTGGLVKTGDFDLALSGNTSGLNGSPLVVNKGFVRFLSTQSFDSLTDIRLTQKFEPALTGGLGFQLPDGQSGATNAAIRMSSSTLNQNQFQNLALNSRITLGGILSSVSGSTPVWFHSNSESGFNLTGVNTFTGDVSVSGGALGIAANANLGNAVNTLILTSYGGGVGGLEFLNDGTGLAHPLRLDAAGSIIVNGSNTNSIDSVISGVGSLFKVGTGTLILNNAANTYGGGTVVSEGRLQLGTAAAIPTGTNVTVAAGAEFNTAGLSNTPATAIGTLTLNGGTFRVPSDSDYHLNQLATTGGILDFSGTSSSTLHLTGAGAGITVNGINTWAASGNTRIQNDSAVPADINVVNYPFSFLTNGLILANGANNQGFRVTGAHGLVSAIKLTNPANTADLIADSTGYIQVADMAYLGSGNLTLQNTAFDSRPGTVWYTGPTAASSKPITLGVGGGQIYVYNPGANLTLSGTIGELPALSGQSLGVSGAFSAPSIVTLTANNTFSGAVYVYYQGVVSVSAIPNGGVPSPLGTSSNFPGSLELGNGPYYGTGTLQYTGPTATTDRGLTLGSYSGAIEVTDPMANLTFGGQFIGPGGLIKTGPGTLTLGNAINYYSGGTFVNEGRLALGSATAIPVGGNVTVAAGATFDTSGLGNYPATAIGTVTLNGGTLQTASGDGTFYWLNKLTVSGGTLDATGATGFTGLAFVNPGAAITVTGNSSFAGSGSTLLINGIGIDGPGAELPITIAPNVTLTSGVNLLSNYGVPSHTFRITGGGTLYLTNTPQNIAYVTVNHARLRLDDLTTVAPGGFDVTLNAGTLAYGGGTNSFNASFALASGGGSLEVSDPTATLTMTGTIAGSDLYPLTKTGPGTLILNSSTTSYAGGLIVNAGRLDVSDDVQLGFASPTVNPAGTLRYTASTAAGRTFNLNGGTLEAPAGVTLALDGATVNGGFLRGAGTFALAAGTTMYGVTTLTSTTVNQTGTAFVANFSNGGAYTVAAGQTLTWNGGTNTSSGRLTVNGTVNATDFVSNGLLTVASGGVLNHTGGDVTLGGGSTTFVGSVANPGGKIDLGGQQLIVRGGLLITNAGTFGSGNGVRNGTTVADYGALVKGTGPYQAVLTQNGGQYLPGNSPGTSQVGQFFVNGGGNLIFEITDAGPSASFPSAQGVAGNNPGWGLTQIFSSLEFTATPSNKFNIDMRTQLAPPAAPNSPGQMSSFDPSRAYSWLIFDLQPGAVFNGTFNPGAINFITTQFANSTAGGQFSLSRTGGQVFLTFTPVPEPALILGVALVGMFGWSLQRRRRYKT
jgi:fibronectin-binding autotransporter adhesin